MGGALSIDTFNRYSDSISSIVLMAPMFKMMYSSLTGLTKVMKHLVYSTKKGIEEMPHFYPDIALNQTYHASRLAKYLRQKSA
jgi:alpha-beta hydrolase superfamily lysophospholipase